MMNSDAARSDAFTKYCIASNMSRDEVSQAAAVFASAWDTGAEYGAERAEAERDALRDELARMSDEFADVLEVAIARGAALGYDSDSDYIQRWEELTGDEWVEE